jgi:hypothetical protein
MTADRLKKRTIRKKRQPCPKRQLIGFNERGTSVVSGMAADRLRVIEKRQCCPRWQLIGSDPNEEARCQ